MSDALHMFDDIESFQTLPIIVEQVFSKMNDPSSSIKEVAEIIIKDQSITAKILKLVNSAYYGFPKRIGTISHAISILGFETVRGLILGISIVDAFNIQEFDLVSFWQHSIRTAFISSFLAKKFHYPREDEAFTIGLIHDMGKLAFMLKRPLIYKKILQEMNRFDEIVILERKHLKMDHGYAGAQLAKLWNFPLPYIEAISQHHLKGNVDIGSLRFICYLSNLLVHADEHDQEDILDMPMLERIQLDAREILEFLNAAKPDISEFLNIMYSK